MLFSTTVEIKQFFPVEKNFTFSTIAPFIEAAQQQYILPVLDEAELLDLEAGYNDGAGTPTTQQLALINALRPALIQLALYNGFPNLNIRITDAGILKSESQDYIPAPGADVYYARTQLLLDGYNALDQLYQFLESNSSDYPLWTSSPAYTQFENYFIQTAKQFNDYVNIQGSRWLFNQMVQTMRTTEMFYVAEYLTLPFYTYLKTQFADGVLTLPEQVLLFGDAKQGIPGIANAIAYYTFASAMVDTNLREQVRIFMVTRPEQLARVENPWLEFQKLADDYVTKADSIMKMMEGYLNNNASASVFAQWFNTPYKYKDPTTHKEWKIENYNNRESQSTFAFL